MFVLSSIKTVNLLIKLASPLLSKRTRLALKVRRNTSANFYVGWQDIQNGVFLAEPDCGKTAAELHQALDEFLDELNSDTSMQEYQLSVGFAPKEAE